MVRKMHLRPKMHLRLKAWMLVDPPPSVPFLRWVIKSNEGHEVKSEEVKSEEVKFGGESLKAMKAMKWSLKKWSLKKWNQLRSWSRQWRSRGMLSVAFSNAFVGGLVRKKGHHTNHLCHLRAFVLWLKWTWNCVLCFFVSFLQSNYPVWVRS